MALQNNLFAQMLILAVCLASALASTRDPKELRTFRLSYSPFYRVPSMHQFRNGVIQRQISSPIDPMIGLGMFFGNFPNFLTQPCPATNECKNCTVCEVCPVMPPPGKITTCTAGQFVQPTSAAPNGTISLNAPATSTALNCKINLVSFHPKTKIKLYCETITTGITATVGPVTDSTANSMTLVTKQDFISKGNVLYILFSNSGTTTTSIVVQCTWTNVPE